MGSAIPAVVTDAHFAVDTDTSTREDHSDITVTDSRPDSVLATATPTSERSQDHPTTSTDMELVDATPRDGPMDMEADTDSDTERDTELPTDGLNTTDMERVTQAPRDP